MHIIGIRIEEGCDSGIVKNLRPGWYPFGDYDEPSKRNGYKWRNGSPLSDRLYQSNLNMPQISISCVIGMNGSGKTTLFDVFFRIINNFASYIKIGQEFDRYALEQENGLNAKLYFEVDGNIGCIDNNEDKTDLYFTTNGDGSLCKIRVDKFSDIVHEFFYTIGVNYSLYSMDYIEDDGIYVGKNKWLCNIYNNEAEYLIPIALTPYRKDGQIDIRREESLANRRLITLSILLHSQGKELIKGYQPVLLSYSFNKGYLKKLKEDVEYLAIRRNVFGSIDKIVDGLKNEWIKSVRMDNLKYSELTSNDIYEYLAYESARICLTYKSYRDSLNLDGIYNDEDRDNDTSASSGKFDIVVDRLRYLDNKTEIASNIHQVLVFLSKQYFKKDSDKEQIATFIKKNLPEQKSTFDTYKEVYYILPPLFYDVELFFSKDDDFGQLISLSQFSSGEKQLLYSHSAILYHIYNIANAKDENGKYPYKHINIIIDEVELYGHPEYQRTYIAKFLDMLAGLHIDNTVIRSINVILATHSPFVISDIPVENILCLENGIRKKVYNESFCANIYDLLKQSFFLEYPMGEVARTLMNDIVLAYNDPHVNKSLKEKIQEDALFYQYVGNKIADPIIRKSINVILQSIIDEKKKGLSDLLRQKDQLKEQMDIIDEQIRGLYEKN